MQALGLSGVPWVESKGARGYRSKKYFSSINIHYDGREDMGVWCEMSGQGCRTFETLSTLFDHGCDGWTKVFKWIQENGCKLTRLDVAYDDHTGILPMEKIFDHTRRLELVSKSDYAEWLGSTKGTSVFIGSPQSAVRIRIYDKAAERRIPDAHWIRCELQLRDDRAQAFTELAVPIGEAFAGVVYNYLRYVIPQKDDSNRWRWPMKRYWRSFPQRRREDPHLSSSRHGIQHGKVGAIYLRASRA